MCRILSHWEFSAGSSTVSQVFDSFESNKLMIHDIKDTYLNRTVSLEFVNPSSAIKRSLFHVASSFPSKIIVVG
jgi:hypothetical protein